MWRAWCAVCGPVGAAGERPAADQEAWRHEVRHWTEESCRASGVPFHVTDPHALAKIAVLLRVGADKPPSQRTG